MRIVVETVRAKQLFKLLGQKLSSLDFATQLSRRLGIIAKNLSIWIPKWEKNHRFYYSRLFAFSIRFLSDKFEKWIRFRIKIEHETTCTIIPPVSEINYIYFEIF